jgi:two-component sensor histidine kinase
VFVRRLHPCATAPSEARHSLDPLEALLPASEFAALQVTVSELVTNAVLHAGLGGSDEIVMTVKLFPSKLRVEVRDPGGGFDHPSRDREHGLGIVDGLADRWGVDSGTGTIVWAELPATPEPIIPGLEGAAGVQRQLSQA